MLTLNLMLEDGSKTWENMGRRSLKESIEEGTTKMQQNKDCANTSYASNLSLEETEGCGAYHPQV